MYTCHNGCTKGFRATVPLRTYVVLHMDQSGKLTGTEEDEMGEEEADLAEGTTSIDTVRQMIAESGEEVLCEECGEEAQWED